MRLRKLSWLSVSSPLPTCILNAVSDAPQTSFSVWTLSTHRNLPYRRRPSDYDMGVRTFSIFRSFTSLLATHHGFHSFVVLLSHDIHFNRWILVSALTLALASSLAEICARFPTSAGAYYWTFRLAPPRARVLLSWMNGWLTLVGVWTIALSVNFGAFG